MRNLNELLPLLAQLGSMVQDGGIEQIGGAGGFNPRYVPPLMPLMPKVGIPAIPAQTPPQIGGAGGVNPRYTPPPMMPYPQPPNPLRGTPLPQDTLARLTQMGNPMLQQLLAFQRRRFGTPPVGPQAPQGPAGYGGAS